MKIRFSPVAMRELEDLRMYLHERSPSGFRNVLGAIEKTVRAIPDSVSRGRSTPHKDVWEKVVPKYGYIIPYMKYRDTVYILQIFNSRREALDYDQLSQDAERFTQEEQ